MSQRLNEYFVQEATEYLEQLERLLALPHEQPDPEHLVRLARGVRGSAQMAGAETVASVAERLEDAARSVASHTIVWTAEVRELVLQTARDLKILVRALNRWGPDEEARVRQALERWDEHADGEPGSGARRLAAVAGAAKIVAIDALFFDDEGPHVLSGPTGGTEAAVPIESLLLRGAAAARAALALRPRLEQAAAQAAGEELRALHEELFDLLALSLPDPTG
jgi:chemotaxis protein histidine kinase CheA